MFQLLWRLATLTWLWRAAFYSLAGFILFLATTPLDYPVPSSSWDKLNHVAAFGVLATLLSLAHRPMGAVLQGAALIAYGLLIEVWQYFLPERHFEWADLLADGIGIVLGLLFMAVVWRQMERLR